MNRKKMHRLLISILLFCTGCSSTIQKDPERIQLKAAIFSGAYDSAYWKEAKTAFEAKHPEVEIVLDINSTIGNIWMPRVDVKDVPDIIYLGSSNESGLTQRMIEDHLIAPLDDVFDDDLQSQFIDYVLDSNLLRPYEDRLLYLAPMYYNVTGLWYNAALFQDYDYEVPKTWEDFFSLGEQAKANGHYLFTYQGLHPTYLEAMLWPMLAEKIGIEGLQAIFTYQEDAWSSLEIKDVIDVFARLGRDGYMQEDTIILNYMEAQRRFIDGEALFLPCGNWLPTEMKEQIKETDAFTFMSVPKFTTEANSYAKVMVEQIYVPKDAKQQELAKQFVADQFAKEQVELNQSLSGGFVPIKQEQLKTSTHAPFEIFNEGVIPIASGFSAGIHRDMDKVVFELLSKVIAQDIKSEEMIEELNNITNDIN